MRLLLPFFIAVVRTTRMKRALSVGRIAKAKRALRRILEMIILERRKIRGNSERFCIINLTRARLKVKN